MRQEKQKKDRREERKRKVKVKTAVSLLNPAYAELRKLIFGIWIRGPRNVRPEKWPHGKF